MKYLALMLVLSVAGGVLAQPTDILVFREDMSGFGTAVITAINNLWPGVNLSDHIGDLSGAGAAAFNAQLGAQVWDIIIVEAWNYDTDDIHFVGLNDLYDTGASKIFVSSWEWESGSSGQSALAASMGVSSTEFISAAVFPHYAWEPTHPICDGIGSWGWQNPGINILNTRFTVSDAVPVTGWTTTPAAGQAGICVANDGASVISGFTPAYADEGIAIWENILEFMWDGGMTLERDTWGAIKASF